MRLKSILEAGRQDFLDAVDSASPADAPDLSWSVLEIIEHVVLVENRYLDWLDNAAPAKDNRDADRELRLFLTIRNREQKRQAPDPVWPQGRFKTLAEALAAFRKARERSLQAVEDRGESLWSIRATHPFFGELNGAELLQLIDGHARRHAEQIREIG
jgi:uncharacterized damage-inducible protein DinB